MGSKLSKFLYRHGFIRASRLVPYRRPRFISLRLGYEWTRRLLQSPAPESEPVFPPSPAPEPATVPPPSAISSDSDISSSNGDVIQPPKCVPGILECQICYSYMSKPIFTCENRHSICGECKRHLTNCPFCRTVKIKERNLVLESWAGQFHIPCRYDGFGCDKAIIGRKLRIHVADCPFRHMYCSICSHNIPTEEFWSHLPLRHTLLAEKSDDYKTRYLITGHDMERAVFHWSLRWMFCYRTNFLCHFGKYFENWCFWITAEENFTNFSCEISFYNTDKEQQITYKGPVNKARTSLDEVADNCNGLILKVDQVKSFMTVLNISAYRPPANFADIHFRIFNAESEPNGAGTYISKYEAPPTVDEHDLSGQENAAGSKSTCTCATATTTRPSVENVLVQVSRELERRRRQCGSRRHSL